MLSGIDVFVFKFYYTILIGTALRVLNASAMTDDPSAGSHSGDEWFSKKCANPGNSSCLAYLLPPLVVVPPIHFNLFPGRMISDVVG